MTPPCAVVTTTQPEGPLVLNTATPALDLVAGILIGTAARHGALVRYADACRSDANDAATGVEREELLAEAAAAEAAAAQLRASGEGES